MKHNSNKKVKKRSLRRSRTKLASNPKFASKKEMTRIRSEFRALDSKFREGISTISELLQDFEKRLSTVEINFEERVKVVSDTVLANLRDMNADVVTRERTSGTRKSPLGRVADEGLAGLPLSGSFESNKR